MRRPRLSASKILADLHSAGLANNSNNKILVLDSHNRVLEGLASATRTTTILSNLADSAHRVLVRQQRRRGLARLALVLPPHQPSDNLRLLPRVVVVFLDHPRQVSQRFRRVPERVKQKCSHPHSYLQTAPAFGQTSAFGAKPSGSLFGGSAPGRYCLSCFIYISPFSRSRPAPAFGQPPAPSGGLFGGAAPAGTYLNPKCKVVRFVKA